MEETCVNRDCVPSRALLAMSGRMRELKSMEVWNTLMCWISSLNSEDKQSPIEEAFQIWVLFFKR